MKASNLLSFDYRTKAAELRAINYPIVDIHTHLGPNVAAAGAYREAAEAFGVSSCLSMTQLEDVEAVKRILGSFVDFIAVPKFRGADPLYDHGRGYVERIRKFRKGGSKIAKFFCAPRLYDTLPDKFSGHRLRLDSPLRTESMQVAADLGMYFMVHVADPDTWFATKYADVEKYGTKRQQYEVFEAMLDRFKIPTIAAHMGGCSEDLDFLSSLLDRHSNLYLDCSATKWIVRELSKHPKGKVQVFFRRWKGRILFGSDLVASDDKDFDLYASRLWALRALFESDYTGPSPIADPDLAMISPEKFGALSSPQLCGKHLDDEALKSLYHDTAVTLLELPA